MTEAGARVCNLTVGDFSPAEFRIPSFLENEIADALRRGETNYPPSNGIAPLREAVRRLYERALGLEYPVGSVLITAGSRPGIYGTFKTLVDPGDRVVFAVPSWNILD
jgi:aspartate aminotransferase